MELSVFDRLILLDILPETIDTTLYGIFHDLIVNLSFSEEEMERLQICKSKETGQARWKTECEHNKDIHINDAIFNLINGRLGDLVKINEELKDEEKIFREEHQSFLDKFLGK